MQVPSNLMLNYAGRPSLYIGFFVVAWGLVSALTSQVKSAGGLIACRFILGFVGMFLATLDNLCSTYLTLLQRHLSLPAFFSTFRDGTQSLSSICA